MQRAKLRFEPLEARDCPSTFADIAWEESIDLSYAVNSAAQQQQELYTAALDEYASLIIFDEPAAPTAAEIAERLYGLMDAQQRRITRLRADVEAASTRLERLYAEPADPGTLAEGLLDFRAKEAAWEQAVEIHGNLVSLAETSEDLVTAAQALDEYTRQAVNDADRAVDYYTRVLARAREEGASISALINAESDLRRARARHVEWLNGWRGTQYLIGSARIE